MFTSVLVANRGEIAVRITKTLRRMGIRAVVLASIPDRHGLAARAADGVVVLRGYSAAETYLDGSAVIAAAQAQGCEAIHPGYGFLSERADFAEACAAAGLVFVGPPPEVLRQLGDKAAARRLALAAGVPVVPGWDAEDDDDTLIHQAARIGFPVMVKARGGGGGRGMRVVHDPHLLAEEIDSARREAGAAFGDSSLLLEKLVTGAHHVEVQVLADQHGNLVHLGERECSVQRRRQKLIEETPSPVVDEALSQQLTAAALKLAGAVGYVNAGTFEFLVAPEGADGQRPFYFLEVNPRLQVEHPVTELVTGLDIVELQLRIAAGEPLPFAQAGVEPHGHAIEFRVNAEEPGNDFRPAAGRLGRFSLSGTRVDPGFATGDIVPAQYDSLLAKIVVHASSREAALAEAGAALDDSLVDGVATNLALHRAVVGSDAFREGRATVDWLEENLASLLDEAATPVDYWVAAAAGLGARRSEGTFSGPGWLGAGQAAFWLSDGNQTEAVDLHDLQPREGEVRVGQSRTPYRLVDTPATAETTVLTGSAGLMFAVSVSEDGDVVVAGGDRRVTFRLVPPPPLPRQVREAGAGATAIVAPLAGTVALIAVEPGQAVEAGQLLLILEAMKMEHRVTATSAGVVRVIHTREQDVVREGDALIELEVH